MHTQGIANAREIIKRRGLDAILITSPASVAYLSGFTGEGDAQVLVLLDRLFIVTDTRYELRVAQECPGFEPAIMGPGKRFETTYELVTGLARQAGIRVLGIEDAVMTVRTYKRLLGQKVLETVDCSDDTAFLRAVKSREEIAVMREAARIAHEAFLSVLPMFRPGAKEKDIAEELEKSFQGLAGKDYGGQSFPAIIASGPNAADPHAKVTDRQLRAGELVLCDFGIRYQGYCSDESNTVAVAEPPGDRLDGIYRTVYEAQQKAIREAKPGMTGRQIDELARSAIREASSEYGYDPSMPNHAVGHGIGRSQAETPYLGKTEVPATMAPVEPGMTFTVEPAVYIPGLGGVRIESVCVMTETGAQEITDYGDRSGLHIVR